MSGKTKTMDSKAVLETIEANPACSTRRVSGEFGIALSSVILSLHDVDKSIKNIRKLLTRSSNNYCRKDKGIAFSVAFLHLVENITS